MNSKKDTGVIGYAKRSFANPYQVQGQEVDRIPLCSIYKKNF